jgi:hypothetical protein
VTGSNVEIAGLSITRAANGVVASGTVTGLVLHGNWIGLDLTEGFAGNTVGVFLNGDSVDGTAIGGTSATERNVISANGRTGVDVFQGDNTQIQGNYIGTLPNGTDEAGNGIDTVDGENIEVTDFAEGTEIGERLSGAEALTQPCDGACNVIADAGADAASGNRPQIDLKGESGETDSSNTTIRGNYVGLGADGDTVADLANELGIAISVNSSDGVTIGGPDPGDMNRLNGSIVGVSSNGGSNNLLIEGNQFNLNFAGTAMKAAPSIGSAVSLNGGATPPPRVIGNRISMLNFSNSSAISVGSGRAVITGNQIGRGPGGESFTGGPIGIKLSSLSSVTGRSTVSGNVLDNIATNNSTNETGGVILENSDGVDVFGNTIGSQPGRGPQGPGIRIKAPTSPSNFSNDNVIGGDQPAEQNQISFSGGGVPNTNAIEVLDPNAVRNTFGRNVGSGNAGTFIDLGGDGPGNTGTANGGIDEPAITLAGADFAQGTSLPGAEVRVFSKATADAGEVEAFLGQATADGSGAWRVEYGAAVPDGKRIVATQTDPTGNTSELSAAALSDAAAPPAPTVTGGPAGPTKDPTPSFGFSPNQGGGTQSCRIDAGTPVDCTGGTFEPGFLPDGPHTFRVTHTDTAENVSPEATRSFTVDTVGPAAPAITAGPTGPTNDSTPSFAFAGESGATFSCAVDGAAPVPCAGGFTPAALGDGGHTFRVSQADAAGNPGPEANRGFTVDTLAPQTRISRAPRGTVETNGKFRARFHFRASEAGSPFQCKLDRKPWRRCRSPRAYSLAPGRHVFKVRATDAAGNRDATPAKRTLVVR